MKATNQQGKSTTVTDQVSIINRPPVAFISCTTNNLLVNCNAAGTYDPEGHSLVYKFDYGDNYIETTPYGFSSHAYQTAGLRTVVMSLTDDAGNVSTASAQVMPLLPPNQLPTALFHCDSTSPLTVVCYDDGSSDFDGSIVMRKITFADGSFEFITPGVGSRHQFTTGGQHEVALTVMDNDGGVTTVTKSIDVKVNNPPVASFECNTYGPQKMNCYSTSTDPDNGDWVSTFDWELGDGSKLSGLEGWFDHTFGTSPTYTVKLTVHDQFGGSASVSKEITMVTNKGPVANIDCQNSGIQTVTCQTFSYDPDGQIAKIHWELDDGFIFDGSIFTHTFQSGEVHNVKISVTDDLGKSASLNQDFHILLNKMPSFDIGADNLSGPPPLNVHFQALNAIDPDGTIASYKWIFADGSTSDQADVTHIFTNSGVYNVKLQITDNFNEMTEKSVFISVGYQANIIINADATTGVAPLTVNFDASESTGGNSSIVKYEWFYLGKKLGEGETFSYNFDSIGNNSIQLTVTDNYGVKSTVSKSIEVQAPALYIAGNFADTAYVGRKYEASFEVIHDSSITVENISYQLVGAPQSIVLDEVNKKISWTPFLQDKGEIEFGLEVSDGMKTFQKKININIFELLKVASVNSAGNSGNVTINLGNNLGNAYIYHPHNDVPYSLNIYQVKDVEWGQLIADTSVPIKNPLSLSFDSDLSVEETITTYEGKKTDQTLAVNPYPRPSKIIRRASNEILCANDLKSRKLSYRATDEQFDRQVIKYDTNTIHIDKDSKNDSKVQTFINIINKFKLDETFLHIYVMKDFLSVKGQETSAAMVVPNSPNSIYINLSVVNDLGEVYTKYTLIHESAHIAQNHSTGCLSDAEANSAWPSGMMSLMESSADYYAFKKLNSVEQREIVSKEYGVLFPEALANPYVIANDISLNGIFASSYRGRLFWEYSPINMFNFFNKYGEMYRASPNVNKTDNDVITALKVSETLGYISSLGASTLGDGLLNLIHYLSNYYRADFTLTSAAYGTYVPMTGMLYDTAIYKWNSPFIEKTIMNVDSSITGTLNSSAKTFQVVIPPMSAVSKNITSLGPNSIGKLTSQYNEMIKFTYDNHGGAVTSKMLSVIQLKVGTVMSLREFTSANTVDVGNTSLIGARDRNHVGDFKFINIPDYGLNSTGLEYYVTHGNTEANHFEELDNYLNRYGFPSDVPEKIYLNFANTSLEPITINVEVKPLCKKNHYSGAQFPNQKLTMTCDASCQENISVNICGITNGGDLSNSDSLLCPTFKAYAKDSPGNSKYIIGNLNNYNIDVYKCGEDELDNFKFELSPADF